MSVPVIQAVVPATGPTSGGDLVRIAGTGFGPQVTVRFGGRVSTSVSVHDAGGVGYADVQTPQHEVGLVDIEVTNLDASGAAIPGETATLTSAYRYVRPALAREADLTRVIRHLLRELKRQVLANVSTTVSVDYDDTAIDGMSVIAMAKLPSVVLTGPTLKQDRFYSLNVLEEDVVAGPDGPELQRRKPPYTVDLVFTITCAADRTAELLNLMAAVATFLNRNRWVVLLRDPNDPSLGTVRWEMDAAGDFVTQAVGKDDVRGFSCGFLVRGFDVDEGLPLDRGKAVSDTRFETVPIAPGGSS